MEWARPWRRCREAVRILATPSPRGDARHRVALWFVRGLAAWAWVTLLPAVLILVAAVVMLVTWTPAALPLLLSPFAPIMVIVALGALLTFLLIGLFFVTVAATTAVAAATAARKWAMQSDDARTSVMVVSSIWIVVAVLVLPYAFRATASPAGPFWGIAGIVLFGPPAILAIAAVLLAWRPSVTT